MLLSKAGNYFVRSGPFGYNGMRKFWILLLAALILLLYYIYWKHTDSEHSPKHVVTTEKPISPNWWRRMNPHVNGRHSKDAKCRNLLSNLTVGSWKTKSEVDVPGFDSTHQMYWRKKGIQKNLWRDDGKCGFKNLQVKLTGSKWPAVGSWCNKDGPEPCCNHKEDGICMEPSEKNCECDNCVDTRKYVYAELSDWHPHDHRCTWTKFDGTQACDVIESSPYNDIRFVGDSLMRNMFAAFMMLLSNDVERGAWGKKMTDKQKVSCVAEQFFFWDDCRAVINSMEDLVHREKLCEGRKLNFTARTHHFHSFQETEAFHKLMHELKGKKGKLVLVGVGMHMGMNAEKVIVEYLGPAVKIRQDFYKDTNISTIHMWPKIFFMSPMLIGLLKPPAYFGLGQNDQATSQYIPAIKDYCDQYLIPMFDFRPLTKLVHSFDGSHFGLGVNLMKNQVLLNFIQQNQNADYAHLNKQN